MKILVLSMSTAIGAALMAPVAPAATADGFDHE